MEIEVRTAKVEADVESLKEIARQQTLAIARLEVRMDQGFAEQGAMIERVITEHRKDFRWLLGIFLMGFTTPLGLMGRFAGLY